MKGLLRRCLIIRSRRRLCRSLAENPKTSIFMGDGKLNSKILYCIPQIFTHKLAHKHFQIIKLFQYSYWYVCVCVTYTYLFIHLFTYYHWFSVRFTYSRPNKDYTQSPWTWHVSSKTVLKQLNSRSTKTIISIALWFAVMKGWINGI